MPFAPDDGHIIMIAWWRALGVEEKKERTSLERDVIRNLFGYAIWLIYFLLLFFLDSSSTDMSLRFALARLIVIFK